MPTLQYKLPGCHNLWRTPEESVSSALHGQSVLGVEADVFPMSACSCV